MRNSLSDSDCETVWRLYRRPTTAWLLHVDVPFSYTETKNSTAKICQAQHGTVKHFAACQQGYCYVSVGLYRLAYSTSRIKSQSNISLYLKCEREKIIIEINLREVITNYSHAIISNHSLCQKHKSNLKYIVNCCNASHSSSSISTPRIHFNSNCNSLQLKSNKWHSSI